MKNRVLMIAAICATPFAAVAQTDYVLPACDIEHEEYVEWKALNSDITLRFKLKGETGQLPNGQASITFRDGHEIQLNEGGSYIYDFDPQNVPICEDHVERAIAPLRSSLLQEQPAIAWGLELKSMSDISKAMTIADSCIEEDRNLIGFNHCKDIKWFAKDLRDNNDIGSETFKQLFDQDAPIIIIPYSAYGSDIYAYDMEKRTLQLILFSGC